MLIFDDEAKPLFVDSIHVPTITENFWVLDLDMMDYTLAPLIAFQEIVSTTIIVDILGFQFPLPSFWVMLVFDTETSQVDVVKIKRLAGKQFTAFVYGPQISTAHAGTISVVDLCGYRHVTPLLNKQQMLCHPINPHMWVNIAPSDNYNKYLKDKTIGDLIS